MCTVCVLAWDTPAPKRARKNKKMFGAAPVAKTMRPNTKVAIPTMGARLTLSASQPSGTMPRTRNPPEIPLTKTMTPELTCSDAWMFGASTASPEPWRLSRVTMMARMVKVRKPTLRRPSFSEVCASPVPGRSASGTRTSSTFSARSRSAELSTSA